VSAAWGSSSSGCQWKLRAARALGSRVGGSSSDSDGQGRCRVPGSSSRRHWGQGRCRAQLEEVSELGAATVMTEERVTTVPGSRVGGGGGGDGDASKIFSSLTASLRNPPVSRF
jgi:hypothetical protein